jgi:hypothetical protein
MRSMVEGASDMPRSKTLTTQAALRHAPLPADAGREGIHMYRASLKDDPRRGACYEFQALNSATDPPAGPIKHGFATCNRSAT